MLLFGNSLQPWVAAQSIFPLPSLKGEAKRLQHLQGTPIGYVLFKRQKPYPIGALLSPLKRAGGAVPFMTGMVAHLLLAKPFT
nr:hypothetical protein [Psychrobacter sp. PraFG1]UNK05150.1 hypothetical protein MN210_14360 [Psychrobacter sp. PraFG1]